MQTKLIVAHRGDRSRAHENTIAAMRYAVDAGADMVEFDVRRTLDGELIIHHDEAIGESLIAAMTYEAVRHAGQVRSYEVPRLSELLEETRHRIQLDVELKESGYEPAVVRLLREHGCEQDGVVITSFLPEAIHATRSIAPALRTGLLVYGGTGGEALKAHARAGTDFLGPDYVLLDDLTLASAAAHSVQLLPWTVNEGADIRRLLESQSVFGVITDYPAEAVQLRAELNTRSSS